MVAIHVFRQNAVMLNRWSPKYSIIYIWTDLGYDLNPGTCHTHRARHHRIFIQKLRACTGRPRGFEFLASDFGEQHFIQLR
jgi:hypothetical protein